MTIRVLETSVGGRAGLRFAHRPELVPATGEILIRTEFVGLNFGEVSRAVRNREVDGSVLGWDAAGIVLAVGAGIDGIGPGAQVVTRAAGGGWAQHRLVQVDEVALVPEGVSLADAAALPTAGVTALTALRAYGELKDRTVLITGASGGVGRFAVQLAHLAGARVIAAVGSEESSARLEDLGAAAVITSQLEPGEPVDLVIDNVGGSMLVDAYARLADGGVLVSVGWLSQQPAAFPVYAFHGNRRRIEVVRFENGYGPLLAPLLELVAANKLSTEITWIGTWEEYHVPFEKLLNRHLRGKAVMRID